MNQRLRWAGCLWITLILALTAGVAHAAIYTYTDENGTIHFTNVPSHGDYRLLIPDAARTPRHWKELAAPYRKDIVRASRRHDVNADLIQAVIMAESAFDVSAISRKGAMGLMQLMPQTAQMLQVKDAFDARSNIEGGTLYLRRMLDRYKDLELSLAAYNAGPTAVDRHAGIPPYAETKQYVRRVMRYYRQMRNAGD